MKGRVLVADDEPSMQSCIAAFLQVENFDVQTVGSAASAMAALDNGEFDVVVTDMAMETQTAGYDVARAALSQPYEPEVVIFTSFEIGIHIAPDEWKKLGVREFFTKGEVQISSVSHAISKIFDERMRRRAVLSDKVNRGFNEAA
jgi:DNA-binding NtrC family response regulator